MTTRGRLFVGVGILIAVLGMGLGLLDLTKVGSLLVVLPVLAALLIRRPLALEVNRSLSPSRIPIDGHSDVTLSVHNTGRATSPILRGEERLAYALGDRPHLLVPRLRGDEVRSLHYRVRSHARGHHTIGPLMIRVSDPFGLATRSMSIPGQIALVVLPKTVPLLPVRGVPGGGGGETASSPRMALHGEDDVGVREYRFGDDLRRIHWRSTARTGETMVRQDEEPTRRRALVVLDDRMSVHAGTGSGGSFEWSVSAAASVTTRLLSERFEVHLFLASDTSGQVVPLEGIDHALDHLAAVQPSKVTSPQHILEALDDFGQHGGGLVVGILGAMDGEDAEVCALRTKNGAALVIDRGGFVGSSASSDSAQATALRLSQGGWRTAVVHPGDQLPGLWEQLMVGRTVRT